MKALPTVVCLSNCLSRCLYESTWPEAGKDWVPKTYILSSRWMKGRRILMRNQNIRGQGENHKERVQDTHNSLST